MNSSEEKFYSSYATTVVAQPSDETYKEFEYGKRYYICKKSLDADPPSSRKLITELGCGNGQLLLYLKDKYGFDCSLGIDLRFPSEQIVGNSRFIHSNLNNSWQIEDNSVDVLIAMMLLEHLFNPFFCFKEVARVLDGNGRAFINLPLVTSIRNRTRLLMGLIPTTSVPYSRWESEGQWDGFHLHYFTLKSIQDLARSAGLYVVSIQGVGRAKKIKDLVPTLLCGEISFEVRLIN